VLACAPSVVCVAMGRHGEAHCWTLEQYLRRREAFLGILYGIPLTRRNPTEAHVPLAPGFSAIP